MREKLPTRRRCITSKLELGGQTVHYSVGFYPDGRIGELFMDLNKHGTALRSWACSVGLLVSLLLQYGAPWSEVVDALKGMNEGQTHDVVGHDGVINASGVVDAIIQAIEHDFPGGRA